MATFSRSSFPSGKLSFSWSIPPPPPARKMEIAKEDGERKNKCSLRFDYSKSIQTVSSLILPPTTRANLTMIL